MSTSMEENRVSSSNEAAGGAGEAQPPPPKPPQQQEAEVVYKTKVIQFLGRSTPIVLQNDNGPCPLLAICNVLLLRNSLHLSLDAAEVSLQKLLSLVAEKLIDSNSNFQDKDEAYVINQQQNIADAIDLLPLLATGIHVNVQFRKINDFEFTQECAIFDLLDIGLYHGWLVDPQDTDTAPAIGSKSYNTLVGDLVAFEASKSAREDRKILEEDSVDFVAATTAALGVPSPCLSRGRSFDDCPVSVPIDQGSEKGDREEAEVPMTALNISEVEMSGPVNLSVSPDANSSHVFEGSGYIGSSASGIHLDSSATQIGVESEESQLSRFFAPQCNTCIGFKDNGLNLNISSTDNDVLSSNFNVASKMDHLVSDDSREFVISSDPTENVQTDLVPNHGQSFQSIDGEGSDGCSTNKGLCIASKEDPSMSQMCTEDFFAYQVPNNTADNPMECDSTVFPVQAAHYADFHSSNGRKELPDVSEVGSLSLDDSEPIYEGEECILDPGLPKYEDQEPVYEGEMVLARQADKMEEDECVNSNDEVVLKQYNSIRNFLETTASQLTIYGLFCLIEGLKERELCVFFRNNHFNTMFKFNGELYLLATDQGYINQSDLVWEKLNTVNGDTVFMTGNFTEFKIENQVSESWNEQSAMTSTADFLTTFGNSDSAPSSFNSDLQLAIALQQQEFGQQSQQQPQRPQQQSSQQSADSGRSRLVTGPQRIPKWWIWFYYLSPVSWTLRGIITSQLGNVETRLSGDGFDGTVKEYLKESFGYDSGMTGITVVVLACFSLLFFTVYALSIRILNFQKR